MCEQCERAVGRQDWTTMEHVAESWPLKQWVTRCPACGQLWETPALHPSVSWPTTEDEVRQNYPPEPG